MSWLHDAGAASGCLDVCSSPVKRLLPFLQVYGSVLPRALPYAIFGAVEGIVLKTMHHRGYNGFGLSYKEEWYDPYALSVFGIVLSFALSMRARVSYFRFWEGAVQCHQLTAKWADACMQVFAFDELSGDAYGEEAFEFRMLFAHFVSLMHACLLIHLRKDYELSLDELSLNMEDPVCIPLPPQRRHLCQAREHHRQDVWPRRRTGQLLSSPSRGIRSEELCDAHDEVRRRSRRCRICEGCGG